MTYVIVAMVAVALGVGVLLYLQHKGKVNVASVADEAADIVDAARKQ